MTLLTIAELQSALGRDSAPFSDDEEGTAQFWIDSVEQFILAEVPGLAFEETEETVRAQADYFGVVELIQYPILDITSVKDARSLRLTAYDWDGFETLFDLEGNQTLLIELEYGFTAVPADLVVVAKSMAYRAMSNPFNVRQQTVGAISETYAAVAGLSQYEEKILAKYKKGPKSLRMGWATARNCRTLPTL